MVLNQGVWPAFWTLGNGVWPSVSCASQSPETPPYFYSQTGEIDIIEGVHDNEHNQVTWHTSAGYYYRVTALAKVLM
jgi:hypothetical protein